MDPAEREQFRRAEWQSMLRRIVSHLEGERSTDLSERTTGVDARVYTDVDRFEAERDRVFCGQPLLAGFSCDLPEPGDRLLFDAAGPPILVVRGRDGALRAFLNLCTHRGARIARDCTRADRLVCPHHGWSFDLDGALRSTPLPFAFDGMRREERGLVPVPVAEWQGLVFVRARPVGAGPDGDAIDVPGFLGPMAPLLEALEMPLLTPVADTTLSVASNWKMALDTFCETYHVPALHRDSLAKNLVRYVELIDHYGRHHRYSGPGLELEGLVGVPESQWPETHYQAVHYLFPNTIITFTHAFDGQTPVVSVFRLFPGAEVGEAVTLASIYRRSESSEKSDEDIRELFDFVLRVVREEDYRVAAESWRSLAHAPAGFRCQFGRAESLLQHYHDDLAEIVAPPLPE